MLNSFFDFFFPSRNLNSFFEFYFPSVDKFGVLINEDFRNAKLSELCKKFSARYGGCTTIETKGNYLHENGTLAVERTDIIKVFYNARKNKEVEKSLRALANTLKIEAKQESVLYVCYPKACKAFFV